MESNLYNFIKIDIDNPIFHLPIKGMALVRDGLFLDVMPSKHVLFLNVKKLFLLIR